MRLPLRPVLKNGLAMAAFTPYSIPVMGLKIGIHHYTYELDRDFFGLFPDSPVEIGSVKVDVQLEKRSDMLVLDFNVEGHVEATCDRCTAVIQLPVHDERQLIAKYGDSEGEEEDEVVFISREDSTFNVAKYLYEFTILSMPITNTYDCQNEATPPCNQEILKYLTPEEDSKPSSDSIWDSLKEKFN
jgi:uncharacterized protein